MFKILGFMNRVPMMSPDGGGSGGTDPNPNPTPDPNPNPTPDPTPNPNPDPKKPFATFEDEKSFMARINREAKGKINEFLKGLGFEKEDDLKAIVDAHNQKIEADKTELQRAQEAKEKAEQTAQNALNQANQLLLTAEAKLTAATLGVKPERVDAVLRLADLSQITIENGTVDKEAVKSVIEKVLTDVPELKGTGTTKGGTDINGGGNPPASILLTKEMIANMSQSEILRRYDEVMKVLKS